MSRSPRARILIADDHQIVLDGLSKLLADQFELVGAVTDGRQLVDAALAKRPDVIVVDVSMPLLNGIDAVVQLRARGCTARVVYLTMHPDVEYASRALEAGGAGYVLKHAAADELVSAIRQVLDGATFISPSLATPALEALLAGGTRQRKQVVSLTPRQREILQLIAEGRSAREIGAILEISSRTVESHKYRMMEDLGLKTSAELVQYAIAHGLTAIRKTTDGAPDPGTVE